MTPQGEPFTLTHKVEGHRIVQSFSGPKGSKEAVYVLEGGQLHLHVRIHSKHLPEDVTYALSFTA